MNIQHIESIEIKKLIPQREPIIMVDNVLFNNEKMIRSQKLVTRDNIFVKDDYMYETGLIENIAQTAAAKLGYEFLNSQGNVPLGYIGAINDLKVHFLPKVNDKLITEVTIENEVMGATFLNGKVFVNDELALECEMKLFIQNT